MENNTVLNGIQVTINRFKRKEPFKYRIVIVPCFQKYNNLSLVSLFVNMFLIPYLALVYQHYQYYFHPRVSRPSSYLYLIILFIYFFVLFLFLYHLNALIFPSSYHGIITSILCLSSLKKGILLLTKIVKNENVSL